MLPAPHRHRLEAAPEPLPHRVNMNREFPPPASRADMRESKKIESGRLGFHPSLRTLPELFARTPSAESFPDAASTRISQISSSAHPALFPHPPGTEAENESSAKRIS